MHRRLPSSFQVSKEVAIALGEGLPIVALESTVITHGLPYPENLTLAQDMEAEIRKGEAIPATIAVLDGIVHVGIKPEQLERLVSGEDARKISSRDFGAAITKHWSGGTTVAGTMLAAHTVGIRILATGGIGGVHRGGAYDVSADLMQLANTPMIVVCAGAKAILDLPATLEVLETLAVPVVGYQTDEFPAFYSISSGLKVTFRADSPEEVAELAGAHWGAGMSSAVLVVLPPPEEFALPHESVEKAIQEALQQAEELGISGQAVTPFLLRKVNELTSGASLRANLGLLRNNAHLGSSLARSIHRDGSDLQDPTR